MTLTPSFFEKKNWLNQKIRVGAPKCVICAYRLQGYNRINNVGFKFHSSKMNGFIKAFVFSEYPNTVDKVGVLSPSWHC